MQIRALMLLAVAALPLYASASQEDVNACISRNCYCDANAIGCEIDTEQCKSQCRDKYLGDDKLASPPKGSVCCESFGFGTFGIKCCESYQWTEPEACKVPDDHVGGGRRIVSPKYCGQ